MTTHSDPQAAPPETDLRRLSDHELIQAFLFASMLPVMSNPYAITDATDCELELLRRLARPDALREKVDALCKHTRDYIEHKHDCFDCDICDALERQLGQDMKAVTAVLADPAGANGGE
jgi:hypothetical protein